MIAKVVRLERLARSGYRLDRVDHTHDGGVVVHIARAKRRVSLRFEHFEVPAVLHLTAALRFAS